MSDPHAPGPSKPLGPRPPYGYAWCDGALVQDAVEAPVRKMIYELLLRLRRKKTVARTLNEAGYRTRDGAEWSDTSIARLIRDSSAMGLHSSNSSANVRVQPIVSEELWKACNAFLDSNDLGRRRGRQATHLFAGFVLCHCGRRMYVRTHSEDYRCSICANRIAATDLEAIFVEQLKDYPAVTTADEPHELHRCWPSLNTVEKRCVVEALVQRIVIGQDDIDFTLCAPANPTSLHPDVLPVAEPVTGLPAAHATEPPPDRSSAAEPKVDPVALAIALMKDHPEWSARKLAQAAGCAHTTLTRSPVFRKAKALAGAKQSRPQGWRLPDGRVEACDDDANCQKQFAPPTAPRREVTTVFLDVSKTTVAPARTISGVGI
jgi:hypothetical protein